MARRPKPAKPSEQPPELPAEIVSETPTPDDDEEGDVGEEATIGEVTREPFGGKGDHDGDGRPGGAHPPVNDPAPVDAQPPREKTLNELNQEARAHDAARREELEAMIDQVRELAGDRFDELIKVCATRQFTQKPLRPPVTA